jgi:hypothetical protein
MRHHIVVAMEKALPVKVECRSCHKQHRYKARPPGEKAPKSSETPSGSSEATKAPRRTSKAAAPAAPSVPSVNPLDALLATRSSGSAGAARSYSPSERYAPGELLSHPNFGLGAVMASPSPGKISVLFRDTTRLLLHERPATGAGAGPKLQPPPRREITSSGAAETPPKTKSML